MQFTQAEGEMKAHASMFSTMGRKPAASSRGVWTGHGGSTFARLAKEASSPVPVPDPLVKKKGNRVGRLVPCIPAKPPTLAATRPKRSEGRPPPARPHAATRAAH